MKHSEYTYQKLFRAIYGYTQTVSKSNGKTYSYYRKGVLSEVPYLKQGKNCVIVPQESFSTLKNFFLTGSNPTHKWRVKGDWKAVYYLNEKRIDDNQMIEALERTLDRTFILSTSKNHELLENEIQSLLNQTVEGKEIDENYKKAVINAAERITTLPWFKQTFSKSQKLSSLNQNLQKLRNN